MNTPIAPGSPLTLAPLSPTAAALLHRLQQEAAEAVAPAPDTVTLLPMPELRTSSACSGIYFAAYEAFDWDQSVHFVRTYTRCVPWVGSENRLDSTGRCWKRTLFAVVDDFGDLIEVAL